MKKTKQNVWIFLGSFIFIFLQLLGLSLDFKAPGLSPLKLLLCLASALALAFLLSASIAQLIDSSHLRGLLSPGKQKRLPYIQIFGPLFLLWMPAYLAFCPGILAYDIVPQWNMYFVGPMSTHHPIIHTLLMCGLFDAGQHIMYGYNAGVAVYSFLQLLAQAAALALALYFMQELKIPRWLFVLSALFYALFPIFPLMGISSTKDTLFCAFFLLAVVIAMKALGFDEKGKSLLLFPFFLWLALLFRNNAVYAVAAALLLALLLFPLCKNKKLMLRILAAMLAAIVAAELSFAALQKATDAKDGSVAEMLCVPTQQIARVYNYHYDELSEQELMLIQRYFPFNNLGNYQPELADPVKDYFDLWAEGGSPVEFARLWLSLGLRFPFTYIDSLLYNTSPLWYLGDESLMRVKGQYLEMEFTLAEPSLRQESRLPVLKDFYTRLMGEGKILDIPVVGLSASLSLYFWLIFAAVILLLHKRRYEFLFIPLLPLLYLATLFLGPCILPRYCLVAFFCMPMISAFLVHLANRREGKAQY